MPAPLLNEVVNRYIPDAKAGDEIAFQFIYYYVYPFVIKYLINKWTHISEVNAELIAEKAFNEVKHSLSRYDNHYPFHAWLLSIVNRVTNNYCKSNKEIFSLSKEDEECLIDENALTPEEEYSRKKFIEVVHNTLSRLKSNRRNVLLLRYIYGYEYKDIVKELSLPSIEAARQLCYNAIKECREILDIERKRIEG